MLNKETVQEWIKVIVDMIPARNHTDLQRFIDSKPEAKIIYPKPDIWVEDHWFCIRRYHDVVTGDNILEVHVGSKESGDELMGYDRIDPRWTDAEGRDGQRWELTRAYIRPKYRQRNYSLFMAELVLALARKNKAKSVVAYPRHVAMLITLLNYGFKTMEGGPDETLRRILKDGRNWYGLNAAQRRLYYAQEFRPFIQDGSFIMEKKVGGTSVWNYLMGRI
jgi:hypothetical protein